MADIAWKQIAVRPLLLWILGILLQVYFPFHVEAIVLPCLALLLLCFTSLVKPTSSYYIPASLVWGIVFSLLTVFVAIQCTELSIRQLDSPLSSSFLQNWAVNTQRSLSEKFSVMNLSDEGKSLLSTITLGNRSNMPWELKREFSAAGVSHILAVSGFHVGVVYSFIRVILMDRSIFGKRRWLTLLGVFSLLTAYVYITGLSASTIRAYIMVMIYYVGRLTERNTDKYNSLAAAALLMLVYNPLYLFDIGFQLSFVAVFSIMFLYSNYLRMPRLINPLFSVPYQWIMITIAAQMGTLFLCLHYFEKSSLVFLFANIPVIMLATLLIPLALIWLFVPSGFLLSDVLQLLVEKLTNSMLYIIDYFSNTAGAVLSLGLTGFETILAYCAMGGVLFLIHKLVPIKQYDY